MRSFVFKCILITVSLLLSTDISSKVQQDTALTKDYPTLYQIRVRHVYSFWNKMIPSQVIIQNAGNMGFLSTGIGWNYGKKKHLETNLLFGLIPRNNSHTAKLTITFKENYIPWNIFVGQGLDFEPLTCGIYINSVVGDNFWSKEPNRYPENYYEYMSTRVRTNIFLGQRISVDIPYYKRRSHNSISFFYEISTCDLYLRAMVLSNYLKLKDIVGLSCGIKMQIL